MEASLGGGSSHRQSRWGGGTSAAIPGDNQAASPRWPICPKDSGKQSRGVSGNAPDLFDQGSDLITAEF